MAMQIRGKRQMIILVSSITISPRQDVCYKISLTSDVNVLEVPVENFCAT